MSPFPIPLETIEETRTKILKEITSDDADVRAVYLKHFESDIEKFSEAMAQAVMNWQSLHADVKGDPNLGQVSAWVITAISLHILSMKLFVSGHIVTAGEPVPPSCRNNCSRLALLG